MKYLITNADDYGYRTDVSQAIIDAHQNGYLTSTTVLINFVSPADVKLAQVVPSLSFGLHLNLTSGEPVTDNWKNKYGVFSRPFRNQPQQFDREVWVPAFTKYSPDDVFIEYEAQLWEFKQKFGQLPTHIDSHHYSSSYPSTFPAYVKLAKKYGLPVRRPKIWEFANHQHLMGNITHIPELEKKLEIQGLKTTTYFSLEYLNRHDDYLKVMKSELAPVKDGESLEISFHPGYEEDWRQKDLKIVKDAKVKKLIGQQGFTLISFADL